MGVRYMCGTLDIGDTRFNDVPFVPSQDCVHWEFCQEDAYRKGREDQGELNAETVREIHDHVYVEAYNKALADYHSAVEYNIMVAGRMDLLVNDEIAKSLLKEQKQ